MKGRLFSIISAAITLVALTQFCMNTANGGPGFDSLVIAFAQPVDGDTLKVSRINGAHAGLPDQWDMRYDAWFNNPNPVKYTVSSVKIDHLNGSTVIRSVTVTPIAPASILAGQSNQLVMVRDQSQYPFPLPKSIRLKFTLTAAGGGSATVIQEHPVAEHENPGPLNAYFFPVRQSDLPKGAFFNQGRHAEDNTFQRWAYDLGAEVWTGSGWSVTRLDKNGKPLDPAHHNNWVIWDLPVYAMSDGLIIGCNRGAVDNEPTQKIGNVAGGNLLWVRTGNETTLYAHLKQNSIPYSLCPFNDDKEHKLGDPTKDLASNAQYRIRAGQLIGRTG